MMMVTVRCRVVCTLLLLALFCCCCSSVCGTATTEKNRLLPFAETDTVNVPVSVSCAKENKLRWRFFDGDNWTICANPLGFSDYSVVGSDGEAYTVVDEDGGYSVSTAEDAVVFIDVTRGGSAGVGESLCLSAEELYTAANCSASCTVSTSDATAFTMNFPTSKRSGVYKVWIQRKKALGSSSPNAKGASQGTHGVCSLQLSSENEREGTRAKPGAGAKNHTIPETAARQSPPQAPTARAGTGGGTAQNPTGTDGKENQNGTPEGDSIKEREGGSQGALETARPTNEDTPETRSPSGENGAQEDEDAKNEGAGATTGNTVLPAVEEINSQGGRQADSGDTITVWVHTLLLPLLVTALAAATVC